MIFGGGRSSLRNFLIMFGWLAAIWIALFAQMDPASRTLGYFVSAIFFATYYMIPILRQRPMFLFSALGLSMLITATAVYRLSHDYQGQMTVLLLLLLFTYLIFEAMSRLPAGLARLYGALAAIMMVLYVLFARVDMLFFVLLYMGALGWMMVAYRNIHTEYREARKRYDALLSEHRHLKRQVKSTEKTARLEERTNIARQIHDSVGHKLTSLLLQLEIFRLNQGHEIQEKAMQMKQLAQESLDETRNAVKALKDQEPGGIPAIIQLIRNLETESYLQIEFSFRYGALSTVLPPAQSVAAYRAIQEALTNAMRHGASRKLSVMLESPGSRVFRFEVTNEVAAESDGMFREGFGLKSMRERIEQTGGTLEIDHFDEKFIVRGTFLLDP